MPSWHRSADDGKALGYFKLFCTAARHLDPLLPGVIFKDGRSLAYKQQCLLGMTYAEAA